ncbi:MAG: hypothetical protein NTZ73_04080 [Candidatus Diapherotrites archaeon]|nr:hypothetical protein [Candidatus Diapherotrites archaeon]
MSTLEALISLIALLAFIGTMLAVLSQQKESILLAEASVNAKADSFFCALTIDSIYSNSIDSYSQKILCSIGRKKTSATSNRTLKETETLAEAESGFETAVKSFGHYIK